MSPYRAAPLQLPPPPRVVPRSLALRLYLGGVMAQLGWGLISFGMIFVWVFAADADYSALSFTPQVERDGVVTAVEATGMSENDDMIHRVRFGFDEAGQRVAGVSYTSDQPPNIGAPVTVQLIAGEPDTAHIEGMRRKPWPIFVVFVGIFPLVGLGLAATGLRRGALAVRLLRTGRTAHGKLVGRKDTMARINKQPVWELSFEFEDADGLKRRAVATTHSPEVLLDEAEEPLLYDPRDPRRVTLLDHLPGSPRVADDGTIQGDTSPWGVLKVLILPFLAVVPHGLIALAKLAS